MLFLPFQILYYLGEKGYGEVATSSWSITMLGDKHFNRNEHWKGGFRFRLGG